MNTRDSRSLLIAYGIAVTSVYVYTVYPSIPGGDSGELIQAAHELGESLLDTLNNLRLNVSARVAHPPGYPLFTMLSWLAMKCIPYGPIAWRTNVLTALFSGAASTLLALTIVRYTECIWISMAGCSLWSFSYLTWTWSTQTEVFSLNNLFVSAIMYLMVEFSQAVSSNRRKTVAFIGCFVCSLALCNQHTIVIYVIVVAAWVLSELRHRKELNVAMLMKLCVMVILGLIPYVYLPISSVLKPGRWTLGDQSTLWGFLVHLFRVEYGTFDLAKGVERKSGDFIISISAYISHVVEDFGGILCMFAFLPIIYGSKWIDNTNRRCLLVKTGMALVYITFFSWRANLGVTKHTLDRGVVERFWMQCDVVIVLLVSVGLSLFVRLAKSRYTTLDENKVAAYVFLFIFPTQFFSGIGICNHRNNTVIAEYGQRMIQMMPNNSLVLLRGDLQSNVMRYFYLCENLRPDIEVFDLEVLGSMYGLDMLREKYPKIYFPGRRLSSVNGTLSSGLRVFDIQTFLDANYDRFPAVINCNTFHPTHTTWKAGYIRYPYGNCWKIIRAGTPIDYEEIILQTNSIHAGWPHKYEKFDGSTWANAANKDIWYSRLEIANKLFEDSEYIPDNETKHRLQIRALQLYNYHIEKDRGNVLPTFWHRNYGAILHALFKRDITEDANLFTIPREDVLQLTLTHLGAYNEKEPNNEDRLKIESIITKLGQVRDEFRLSGKWDI